MQINRVSLIGLAALASAALGCDLGRLGVAPESPQPTAPAPAPTATVEPTPSPTTAAAEPTLPPSPTLEPTPQLVFVEPFDNNRNDWFEGSVSEAQVFVRDGVYSMLNPYEENVDNFVFGVTRVYYFEGFDLVVEITQAGGADNSELGVVLGYANDQNFYRFVISADGLVGLFQVTDNELRAIEEFFPSGHVIRGNATNRVRLVVESSILTAYVNGERVLEKPIPGYRGGFVGLGCGAFEPPEVTCSFDNLLISEL